MEKPSWEYSPHPAISPAYVAPAWWADAVTLACVAASEEGWPGIGAANYSPAHDRHPGLSSLRVAHSDTGRCPDELAARPQAASARDWGRSWVI